MGIDLSVIWFVIIVFATLMYIVMDGFDLGIGILFPVTRNAEDRDVMVNSVAPVWDGNETWLVLGGAGLFGAFPMAYAVIIDALTIPLTLMLIGLIFRGVAFEFRFKATPAHRPFWDHAFLGGSILATFAQGIVVGAVINGFPVTGRSYSGGPFDWLTPFTLFCGVGLVVAYALLGATWLVMKSENPLQDKMRSVAKKLLLALVMAHTGSSGKPHVSVCADARANLPWFQRPGHQYLAAHYSAFGYPLAGSRPRPESGVYAGRCAAHHSGDFGVHLLELLCVSRQSATWRGVSLMQHSLWKRLMWLVILWGGSVLALAAVGMFFRLLMTAAGFKAH